MGELLWTPSAERSEGAEVTRFTRWVEQRHGLSFATHADLWRWSVTELEDFWAAVWEYFGVKASKPYERVLADERMPGAHWFPGAELNYAEHIFRRAVPDATAIVETGELHEDRVVTWAQLERDVARAAAGMRALGVERGDRVVAYLPNASHAIVALLACMSLGAVWSSCSPDFGTRSVVDRFAQIEPTLLIAVDGYRYGGRDFDRRDTVAELQAALPTLRQTVLVPYLHEDADPGPLGDALPWERLLALGDDAELSFEQVPADHPLWILYSSGTTGIPKAIVHGHGGMLLEHLKNGHLQLDLGPDERIFWFTTTGWMMWNLLVSFLLTGCSIVTYDGSPGHPGLDFQWELAERTGITYLGTSAGFLTSCLQAGLEPGRDRDLSALRSVGSSGSPLPDEEYRWIYEHVGSDLWVNSTTGGTDVCAGLAGGSLTLPVHAGEMQTRLLGVSLEAWDERGNSVVDEVGELVVTRPMPSMPLCFWNDPGDVRLRESYFEHYPGVWRHGDWVEVTARGTVRVTGRSDSTINRQGIRMGTAEIYRAATAVPEVVDALVVDLPREDALWMPLFVVLREGATLDDELVAQVKRRIRSDCSPRHVPDVVIQVERIPRTLTGKVIEVPVKRILMGVAPERVVSADALEDPSALAPFVELAARLRGDAADVAEKPTSLS